ncbi:nucleoside deaminase [Gramella sp. GC03-9]|uniref:Nucleoside deaminase n=1 Tax=Christiangramia oceanisediminis TaxID=2920386 RepID=A0A9X2R8N9_9FLAO|nr:nucleoside deaminase [Gramella oceanisediminis]MCP9200408.1 nucleoside deaminase [Gramella oceanisediminis]
MEINQIQYKMMNRAIELAREGGEMDNGGPFGAVIARGDEIIAEARNQVLGKCDCTQHAELRAIQRACKKLNSTKLKGCALYTSCEPCMMCLGASYWAELDYLYFGASAEDAKKHGFIYSDLYYNSDTNKRHEEFNMIQLNREKALAVWETRTKSKLQF